MRKKANQPLNSEKFLRVSTPVTTDGINLAYDEEGQKLFRVTFLPYTAMKHLERENSAKPSHLRHTIEILTNKESEKKEEKQIVEFQK